MPEDVMPMKYEGVFHNLIGLKEKIAAKYLFLSCPPCITTLTGLRRPEAQLVLSEDVVDPHNVNTSRRTRHRAFFYMYNIETFYS